MTDKLKEELELLKSSIECLKEDRANVINYTVWSYINDLIEKRSNKIAKIRKKLKG